MFLNKVVPVWAVARLVMLLGGVPAFAQSSGGFAGDFVSADIIRPITCATDDTMLECTNGGTAFLGATIKVPAARSKALLITGSLQANLLASNFLTGGSSKTSTAFGGIVVRPTVTGPNGQDVPVFSPAVTFAERRQELEFRLLSP